MRDVVIREYQDSDYPACLALEGELAQHEAEIYGDPSIAGDDPGRGFDKFLALDNRRGIWVAEADGRVVGLAGLLQYPLEKGVVEIEPLVVAAGFRKKGIGSMLVRHVI